MSDDKTNRGPADAKRVNIHEKYEVEYWTKKWGVTEQALKDCHKKVGSMADDIARCLGK